MPPELIPDESDYASSEDSDFAPDAAPVDDAGGAESSDDEQDVVEEAVKKPAKRKRGQANQEDAEDAGFENSGDEAIIERGLKRQRKKGKGKKSDEVEVEADDEGGEGGLVKTRSMRAAEKVEKKTVLVDTSKATVDVDALWEDMMSGKAYTPIPAPTEPITNDTNEPNIREVAEKEDAEEEPTTTLNDGPDTMIMIKRTYTFAGKAHTEEKLVPRSSAEAKLFLSSNPDPSSTSTDPASTTQPSPFTKPKRPTKKARKSIFEPIIDLPLRTDLHFGAQAQARGAIGVGGVKDGGKKLNTVEKSAMDWAGFVDKEGIADELDAAGKAKGAFKARQEFLARVERKKEEEERRARGLPV
ncbi:SWR1-complex protein [Lachnellula hyalina]|uniref:SWR1-complex protein 5 n=1 Tax=Lachnellula hyalina TaxID=1316788 RepID=A0A8H8U0H3_9HELO|nr:SWR1-complex protein [Lachnellula hyalina]TVY29290.1 SWR1-complex protein [Lachnellula hyalina]